MTKIITFWNETAGIPPMPNVIYNHIVFVFPFKSGYLARVMYDERVQCANASTFWDNDETNVMRQVTESMKHLSAHEDMSMKITEM